MPKFRVYLILPDNATPLQSFHMTEKSAREHLKLLLDAGQPKGTRYAVYKLEEKTIEKGEC